jgi:hypothetical protein
MPPRLDLPGHDHHPHEREGGEPDLWSTGMDLKMA